MLNEEKTLPLLVKFLSRKKTPPQSLLCHSLISPIWYRHNKDYRIIERFACPFFSAVLGLKLRFLCVHQASPALLPCLVFFFRTDHQTPCLSLFLVGVTNSPAPGEIIVPPTVSRFRNWTACLTIITRQSLPQESQGAAKTCGKAGCRTQYLSLLSISWKILIHGGGQ